MQNLTGELIPAVVAAALTVCAPRANSVPAQERVPVERNKQETEGRPENKLVDMPFASISGLRLIGNTECGSSRRWLVQPLPSGRVHVMHRAYPRFPVPDAWNRIVDPWHDRLHSSSTVRPRGFPKWRANEGRLMFYWGRGFTSAPPGNLCSGFFMIPYELDAIDYLAGSGPVPGSPTGRPTGLTREYRCVEEGKLLVQRSVSRFGQNTPVLSGSFVSPRGIINHLYEDECAGCDFVIGPDGRGLFFTSLLPNGECRHEDLPSKMIVFGFCVRDQKRLVPSRDSDDVDTCAERNSPPSRVIRPSESESIPLPPDPGPSIQFGLGSSPGASAPPPEPPEATGVMEWRERESFQVPFRVPFTAAVDGDDWLFLTNGGAIYRASPSRNNDNGRVCTLLFQDPSDPIIACVHLCSTNRVFGFRKNSYVSLENDSFPERSAPRFIACDDITLSKPVVYVNELGIRDLADWKFQLVSQAGQVLWKDCKCRW